MDNMIIVGKDCESCIYSTLDESEKPKIKIECAARKKSYIWGQCIPCNDKRGRR